MLTPEETRARLATIQSDVTRLLADIDAPPAPVLRLVRAGDNLPSLIANGAADALYVLDRDFLHVGSLPITKPVTIYGVAPSDLPDGRIAPGELGPVKVRGPIGGLGKLVGVDVEGLPGTNMLDAGDGASVDRCVFHAPKGAHRGWLINCRGFVATRSHVSGIWSDQDTQAICGYDGTQDAWIDNCYLEASGENILFGGAEPSSADRIPTGIVISKCELAKRPEWLGDKMKQCKNLIELKNARQVEIRDCTGDYSFTGGQGGYAIVLSVRNEKG